MKPHILCWSVAIVVGLLISKPAGAGQYCQDGRPGPCTGSGTPPVGSPLQGEPFNIVNGNTDDRQVDLRIPGSIRPLTFARLFNQGAAAQGDTIYGSMDSALTPNAYLAPFGHTSSSGLKTWHSLFSFATVGNESFVYVTDGNGFSEAFGNSGAICSPAPCIMQPDPIQNGFSHDLLWWSGPNPNGPYGNNGTFVLIRPGDGNYVYNQPFISYVVSNKMYWFLSRIEAPVYNNGAAIALATLKYAPPSDSTCPGGGGPIPCAASADCLSPQTCSAGGLCIGTTTCTSDANCASREKCSSGFCTQSNGVPYLSQVLNEDGAGIQLNYTNAMTNCQAPGNWGTSECVLSSLSVIGPGGTVSSPAVQYTYEAVTGSGCGTTTPGRLANVSWTGLATSRDVNFTYSSGGNPVFQKTTPTISGTVLTSHSYDGLGHVSSDVSAPAGLNMQLQSTWYQTGSCSPQPSNSFCDNPRVTTFADNNAGTGDGNFGSGTIAVQHAYTDTRGGAMSGQPGWWHGGLLYQSVDSCPSPGTQAQCAAIYTGADGHSSTPMLRWDYSNTAPFETVGSSDARGSFVAYNSAFSTGQTPQQIELRTVFKGSTDVVTPSSSRLEETDMTYGYATQGFPYSTSYATQHEQTETKPSVLQSGQNSVTTYTYDTLPVAQGGHQTQRLLSVIKSGYTQFYSSGSTWTGPTQAYVGTFYFPFHSCSGEGWANADPKGRTLEVHGPCRVVGTTSTDCDCTNGACPGYETDNFNGVPVTQYFYYGATGNDNANRLNKVTQFPVNAGPASCSVYQSQALTTTYANYDKRGNPQTVTTPDQVAWTYTYEENRPLTKSANGLQWTFTYDHERLTSVHHPASGSVHDFYEVFCYRGPSGGPSYPPGACDMVNGTFQPLLQWKAKSPTGHGDGTSPVEQLLYFYNPDSTLKEADYYDSTGKRRIEQHQADAHRRPTFDGVGTGSGSYAIRRGFDASNNLQAVGPGFNAAPAWCLNTPPNGPLSQLCAQFQSDRADRLGIIDQFPKGAADPSCSTSGDCLRTCLDHDTNGNVTQVCPGYDNLNNSSQSCAGFNSGSNGTSTCNISGTTVASTYLTDDFGNVVQANLPWGWNYGPPGVWHFEYNALGDRVREQSQEMRAQGEITDHSYDPLGREIVAIHFWNNYANSETLYSLTWDNYSTVSSSGNCPTANVNSQAGRLAARGDSFGITWYSYDFAGRAVNEYMLRFTNGNPPAQYCATAPAAYWAPQMAYAYSPDGERTSVTTTYARQISYTIGSVGRPTSAGVVLCPGGTCDTSPTTILQNIAWEPYGGLRGYQIAHPRSLTTSSIEYQLGDNSTLAPDAGQCGGVPSMATGSTDLTGRLRALAVSSGAQSLQQGTGDLYKLEYTWNADQVVQTDACLLGLGNGATEQKYTYDNILRLTGSTGSGGEGHGQSLGGGVVKTRTYGYTPRSNRSSTSDENCTYNSTFYSPPQVDQLVSVATACTSQSYGFGFANTQDGSIYLKKWANDSSGGPAYQLQAGYGTQGHSGGEEVFKSLNVSTGPYGGNYNYYYDAFGRRRLKVYPVGNVSDEYFHLGSSELLTDQGNDTISSSPSYFTVEDYVWLGGRPVAVVRGKFSTGWVRQDDWSTTCTRYGEATSPAATPCGVYFPVTDHIGKPVVTLDSWRNITGVGDYDPFGRLNQVSVEKETPHPYTSTSTLTAQETQATGGSPVTLQYRTLFHYVDTFWNSTCNSGDTVSVVDHGGSTLWGPLGGYHLGQVWSGWVKPTSGSIDIDFRTGSHISYQCNPTCGCKTTLGGAWYGTIVDSYQYRKYSSTAPYWVPLRFPGQYYDAESDLVENWHRYYDPVVGRYFESDPLLNQTPEYYSFVATTIGMELQPYSYAFNNPVRYSDVDGRFPDPFTPGWLCTSSKCGKDDLNGCKNLPEDSPKQWNQGELQDMPAPGTCTPSDGFYSAYGIVKIPNNCMCVVPCDQGKMAGLVCSCPGQNLYPDGRGKPKLFPPGTPPPAGWPTNPFAQGAPK